MYYAYFGLKQPPFKITPDTSLFFPGGNRGATLQALTYAILNGEGIVKVVGEVGAGKTMLCRMLQVELPENVEVVYLANPSLSPENILHAIALELDLPVKTGDNRLQVMQALQSFLLAKHAENRQVVMFVEEAQGMPLETLEEIRLLSNLETQQDKLLQIVLFGQPELDEHLAEAHIRQLKERITYSFYLPPLKVAEIRDYLNSRLRASGHRGSDVFTGAAVRAIARSSEGLLRRINILADKAMLAAYAANATRVGARHVARAARDSEFELRRGRSRRIALALAAALVLAAGALLLAARSGALERLRSVLSGAAPAAGALAATKPSPLPKAPVVAAKPAAAPGQDAGESAPAAEPKAVEAESVPAAPAPAAEPSRAEAPKTDISAKLFSGAEIMPTVKPMLDMDTVSRLAAKKNEHSAAGPGLEKSAKDNLLTN